MMNYLIKFRMEYGTFEAKQLTKLEKIREFLKYYFCYGQIKNKKTKEEENPPEGANKFWVYFCFRRPHWITVIPPMVLIWIAWVSYMASHNLWSKIFDNPELPGWYITLMMLFGSFVAGATSEGGGAIAFPVMSLVLQIHPSIARDFSFMIQSVGMTSAAFTIIYSGLVVEKWALLFSSIGGVIGIVIGLQWIDPIVTPAGVKMFFVSVWLSFAISLFVMNLEKSRPTRLKLEKPTAMVILSLVLIGILGGMTSALTGSGLDIATFSMLVILFRLTEKTATPTSVLLMAFNTIIGFFYRGVVLNAITEPTWNYWLAAVPIVPIGAPIGAFVSSFLHRQVLAWVLYILDITQFVAACIIIRPFGNDLIIITTACLGGSLILFGSMSYFGKKFFLPNLENNTDISLSKSTSKLT